MPLGIVSDSEFDAQISDCVTPSTIKVPSPNSPNTSNTRVPSASIVDIPNKGRKNGDFNVPSGLRNLIGETSITDGRPDAVELASRFGISASSASAYANGSTSTSTYEDRPNLDKLNSVRERISKKARNKLIKAINNITDGKLSDAKPEVLASVARHMSAIVKDMEPEKDSSKDKGTGGPTFVFYAPQFAKEESFKVIHAKE